jgi:hypothetical protein
MKISELKKIIETEVTGFLSEGAPEFDEGKMLKLVKSDKFLTVLWKDRFAKTNKEKQAVGLEAMYQTFIVQKAHGDRHIKAYKSISENIDMLLEGWKGYKPNMPVQAVGVKNNKITGSGRGVQVFKNLKAAQKVFPPPHGIDPDENTMQFTWVTKGEVNGKPAGRFETWAAYDMYSRE